jgi:hypothetical protein
LLAGPTDTEHSPKRALPIADSRKEAIVGYSKG